MSTLSSGFSNFPDESCVNTTSSFMLNDTPFCADHV